MKLTLHLPEHRGLFQSQGLFVDIEFPDTQMGASFHDEIQEMIDFLEKIKTQRRSSVIRGFEAIAAPFYFKDVTTIEPVERKPNFDPRK